MASHQPHPRPWRHVMAAFVAVAVAALIRLQLLPMLGTRNPYLTFYPAVMLAALYGGWSAGLLATVLSACLVIFFFIEPVNQFVIRDSVDWLGMAVFAVSCTIISLITKRMQQAKARAAELNALLKLDAEHVKTEETRMQLAAIVESSGDAIISEDLNSIITQWNSAAERIFGYSCDEIVGRSCALLIPPESSDREMQILERIRQGGSIDGYETECIRKDGTHINVSVTISPIRNVTGTVVGASKIGRDITQRKRTEAELRLVSSTIDNLAEQVFWIKSDGFIWNVNRAACTTLGYRRTELLGLSVADIDLIYDRQRWQSHWEELKQAGSLKFESLHKTREGRVFPVEITAHYFNFNDLEYNCAIIRDITERKEMERALQESEAQFRFLCDAAPVGIFRTDVEGNCIYSNPRWEQISGLPAAQSLGQGWTKSIHPDFKEEILRTWLEATTYGRSYEQEYQLGSGRNTTWVRALASPLKDGKGTITGYVGTVEEITELRQAREELLKTQKLESLGVLAGGLAHDFNNLLTSILGNISLARMQMPDQEKVTQRLADAEKAGLRAGDLSQQLLTFARGGAPVKKILRLGTLLKDAAGFAIHGSPVRCEFIVADDLWPVEADEGQLSQVIHNLVINSVQAMPDGGTLTIAAENQWDEPSGENSVKITVADTGSGISEEHLQNIFDPYFTTKKQGTGLGLSTCYSIIKKHGGSISVSSPPGHGARFYIHLPAAPQESSAEALPRTEVSQGSGRVLVMDDEEDIRRLVQVLLEELGYTVECVEDGIQAVERYCLRKDQGQPFSAVILDLTLPGGVGGKEAIKMLMERDPAVKAIVSSGYSTDPIMANYREYGFSAVLSKPYRPEKMSKVLQTVLSSN